MNKFNQKMKFIVRNNKAKRTDERFKCYCCGIIFDKGWKYETEDSVYCFCYTCKNKYALGKMKHSGMIIDGDYERNK